MAEMFPVKLRRDGLRAAPRKYTRVKGAYSTKTCCPLPFFLQDLCLLVVINELDHYPTELLAALPYWLRCRILLNIPALDLSRLELTAVTSGVDTDSIWKLRLKADDFNTNRCPAKIQHRSRNIICRSNEVDTMEAPSTGSPFQLDVSRGRYASSSTNPLPYGYPKLTKGVVKELNDAKDLEISIGNCHQLEIASDLLTDPYGTGLEKVTHQLLSIPGNYLLSNLLVGSMHHDCRNPFCNQELWKKQASPLSVRELNTTHVHSRPYNNCERKRPIIRLVPRRLLSICVQPDPVELLSLLSKDCQLRPHGVNIHFDTISQSFLLSLQTERLALDGRMRLPTEDAKYTYIINGFLGDVVSLRLQCSEYNLIGLMVSMIKAAVVNGQASNLKHLICAMPDLYVDIVDSLCALFSLQNFCLLSLDLNDAYPLMLSKLLQAFITSPCPHTHKLLINVSGGSRLRMSLKENQVASVDMKGVAIHSCGLQHKVLKCSSYRDLTRALYILLQFPSVRLKDLKLFVNSKYLHLCAIHPDLLTTKLKITIVRRDKQPRHKATLQQDITSLLKIRSLEKVCIRGTWGSLTEGKLGLVFGLQCRAHLSPLKKLLLELKSENCNGYDVQDFEMLCDALFSLPQLENLELILGKGFSDMMQEQHYEDVMYKSWSDKGGEVKLKSICVQTHIEIVFKRIIRITQNLSLSISQQQSGVDCRYDYEYYSTDSDDDF